MQLNTRTAAQLVLKDPDFILSNVTGQVGEISFCCPDLLFSFHWETSEETKLDPKTFQAIALMELEWLTVTRGSLMNQYGSKSVFCTVFSDPYSGTCCSR